MRARSLLENPFASALRRAHQAGAPLWLGILNATPDSFSDGGLHFTRESALERARILAAHGCQAFDVGGVSTRPGSFDVPPNEEWARVRPVLEGLRALLPAVPVSLDTSSPTVLRLAAEAGLVDAANDVWAGRKHDPHQGADVNGRVESTLNVCAEFSLPIVLMHMQGTPLTMQSEPCYASVVEEVSAFLAERARAAQAAGVEDVLVDPGVGFGKTLEDNLALLSAAGMAALSRLGYPVLIGLSRKRFLAALFPGDASLATPMGRDAASKTLEWSAFARGARAIRTHRAPTELT